jgi:hypothetical protein
MTASTHRQPAARRRTRRAPAAERLPRRERAPGELIGHANQRPPRDAPERTAARRAADAARQRRKRRREREGTKAAQIEVDYGRAISAIKRRDGGFC